MLKKLLNGLFGDHKGGFNPEDTKYDRKAEKLKKKAIRDEQAKIT